MSHPEQKNFCQSVKKNFPQYFTDTFVLDIGSLDINGNNRELFEYPIYLGLDVAPGRNVDLICKASDLQLPKETFDVIISTECFEHDKYYEDSLKNACRMLKPGGLLLFTCATIGRPEHGTVRTTPHDAPLIQGITQWEDYYKNLTEGDIRNSIDVDNIFRQYQFSINNNTHDLYFFGIKNGTWEPRRDYSVILAKQVEDQKKEANIRQEISFLAAQQLATKAQLDIIQQQVTSSLLSLNQVQQMQISLANENQNISKTLAGVATATATAISAVTTITTIVNRSTERTLSETAQHFAKLSHQIKRTSIGYRLRKPIRIMQKLGILNDEAGQKGLLSRLAKSTKTSIHTWTGYKSNQNQLTTSPGPASRPFCIKSKGSATILTTPHTRYVAQLIADELHHYGYNTEIIFKKPETGYQENPHFVVCPQMFNELPPVYVAFQMEQSVSSRWFTEEYISTLENSYAILDYSHNNIEYLQSRGLSTKQIYYVPVSAKSGQGSSSPSPTKDIDVLFYGDDNCQRRREALNKLREHVSVTIVNNTFGDELTALLRRAKVVVNIHYYEGALLESTRIFECLSEDVVVVSEESTDQADYEGLTSVVRFVPIGRFDILLDEVKSVLNDTSSSLQLARALKAKRKELSSPFRFYFGRFLLASDNISFEQFYERAADHFIINSEALCLGLPEYGARKQSFLSENQCWIQYFPGLRHEIGWLGCALSYKFLARKTLDTKRTQILICEDDVDFRVNSVDRLNKAKAYLKTVSNWDVFSGLIANLHQEAKIVAIDIHDGESFIHMDKMVSTVLNIYNTRAVLCMSQWDPENRDVHTNTIDRYLENTQNLDIVTTLPFIVGHKEDLNSILWGFNNSTYRDMISASEKLLSEKVESFHASNTAITNKQQ